MDMSLRDEITPSINPGDDFYSYVNKKWCDDNPIPADKARYSAMTELGETVTKQLHALLKQPVGGNELANSLLAKKLYLSGMDEAAIEQRGLDPLLPYLRDIEHMQSAADVKACIAQYHSKGRGMLWRLGIDVDEKNSERYTMIVTQSGLLLPDRDYYFETSERFEKTRQAYKEFLTKLFDLLGKDDVATRAANVYTIEEKLAAASNTSIENRDIEALHNPFTFAELAERFVGFDWAAYQDKVGLQKLDGLIIHQPKFVEEALRLIDSCSIEAWQDYLVAHTVVPYMPFLAKRYSDVHFAFFGTTLTGAEHQEDRYKRIVRTVSAMLPEPTGRLYTEAHFDEASKAAITDLVSHIQEAMRERITRLDWMSDETKQKALEKLDTFMPLLGYPDTWRSYESLVLQDDYVANILAIKGFNWHYDVERSVGPVDRKEWLMSPAEVNAYYWPNTNGITFPAAILQPPMFDATGDFAANYGAIGMVIGHEIIHGFDDNGAKYDKIGNLNSWWTKADRTAFEARVKALSEQYDQYEVDGQHVKGELTLGENIADLGGMLIAYDALQKKLKESGKTEKIDGFTPEQRFFLAQARIWRMNIRPELALQFLVSDPHSPAHLRVNGVIRNVDAWYDAWGVTEAGALYKPVDERIRIW
jgi:putative endopeptidase